MNQKALVVISFGSTFDDTRKKDIGGIEAALATAFPAFDQYRAFTSNIIRKRLSARGILIDDVETVLHKQAMRRLCSSPPIYSMAKSLNKKY